MFKGALAACLILVGSSMASAAIIYEPVQYQYGTGQWTYYYGGTHPQPVNRAMQRAYAFRYVNPNFQPNNFIVHTDFTPAVFSDDAPGINMITYGYTPTDAMNEANASVPRYFQKSAILAAGHVDADGSWVVPAQAHPVEHVAAPAASTATTHEAIIIIPKRPANAPAAAPTKAAVDIKTADAR
ncbi:MAG TPA: hypothetical protein VH370_21150 [Humisphaera sp.]|nr:hypothetical protein [Humisphaera sp.]